MFLVTFESSIIFLKNDCRFNLVNINGTIDPHIVERVFQPHLLDHFFLNFIRINGGLGQGQNILSIFSYRLDSSVLQQVYSQISEFVCKVLADGPDLTGPNQLKYGPVQDHLVRSNYGPASSPTTGRLVPRGKFLTSLVLHLYFF